jgi:hypothetical protein
MTFTDTAITGQRFKIGRAVITQGALAYCEDHDINYLELLMRHAIGDFGDVGKLDKAVLTELERQNGPIETSDDLKLNAIAIESESQQGNILSIYSTPEHRESKIWIQTLLADEETYTTILLPSEY